MSLARTMLVARMFLRMVGRVPSRHLAYLLRLMRFEKAHRFRGQVRINTFFPPYPSLAFDRFCRSVVERRRVPYSTYVAVTGRCPYRCGHCSYAGRNGREMSREQMLDVIRQVKTIGACTLGLTGGEPLLRNDLEDFITAAAPEMTTIVFTTGHGLDARRGNRLAEAGVGCVTLGLESSDPATHDRVRGCEGSFDEAAAAARACRDAGIYLAISTVGTREKLANGDLESLYALAAEWRAGEFRLLASVATGAWRGNCSATLTREERSALADFHRTHNHRGKGPAVASFAWLESDAVFGCGAGFHHLFIDAAGHVCPCDLTPLSFGDVTAEPLVDIWNRMGMHFPTPRRGCLMNEIGPHLDESGEGLPLPAARSAELCDACRLDGSLPEGYRRLIRPGETFKPPAP